MDLSSRFLPETDDFRGISLCAGYAGLDLGLHIAEPRYRTVAFVERESHAAATLVARMADKALAEAAVWDDLGSFNGREWRGRVHLISAGYPCQPFSYSGRRGGEQDPRHMWPEVARIVREVQPEWVFCENVEGHLSVGFENVVNDLRDMGYSTKAGLFTAREVGARHRRRRLFLLAHADSIGRWPCAGSDDPGRQAVDNLASCRPGNSSGTGVIRHGRANVDVVLVDDECDRMDPGDEATEIFAPGPGELRNWQELLLREPATQPALPREADGLADRLDRTRGVGNGVCSLAAALAWSVLKSAHAVEA